MIKYPSIEQFRHIVINVKRRATYAGRDVINDDPLYDESLPLPTLKFTGSIKLHGTNAGVVYNTDGTLTAQSRERELAIGNDNRGFAKCVHTDVPREVWDKVIDVEAIKTPEEKDLPVTIFGEWCGSGIASGVAIKKLPYKMFVIFAVLIGKELPDEHSPDERRWLSPQGIVNPQEEHHILSICDFPTKEIEIDFDDPQTGLAKMEAWVDLIDAECPVGKALGVEGHGEGLVFSCITPGYVSPRMNFKVKGEKHKIASTKPKKVYTPEQMERKAFVAEIADGLVSENRLTQGLDVLRERGTAIDIKAMTEFINWNLKDVLKEEYDVLEEHQITKKEIGFPVATKAREWFKLHLDKESGLA